MISALLAPIGLQSAVPGPITLCSRAFVVAALVVMMFGGCRSAPSEDEDSGTPPLVTMAVTGARAVVKPMHSELRLVGQTEARRHVSLRAPAAGRVIGFNLQTGDRVRQG